MKEGPGAFSYRLPSVWFFGVWSYDHGGFVRGAWIPPFYACLGVSINGYVGRLRCFIGYMFMFLLMSSTGIEVISVAYHH